MELVLGHALTMSLNANSFMFRRNWCSDWCTQYEDDSVDKDNLGGIQQ